MSTWNFEYRYTAAGKTIGPAIAAVETTPEEAAVIRAAEADWRPVAKEAGLEDLKARAALQIREAVCRELCSRGDEYALKCAAAGTSPFDGDYKLQIAICEPEEEL